MTLKPLTSKSFAAQFTGHAVIDTNHLSPTLTKTLGDAGVSIDALKKLAGPDGQIKGAEFKALFALVDGFDGKEDARLALVDGSKALTLGGQLNQALLDEVKSNRGVAQYGKPGTASAPPQPRLLEANALVVDVKDRKAPVALPVKGLNQFTFAQEQGIDGHTACFPTAVAQAERYNTTAFGRKAPQLNGPDGAIQIAFAEDAEGRLATDPTQARLGREYIDKALDAGFPVVVGASYEDDSYNHDRLTEHFVTIHKRGYDDAGRLFYDFRDPGAQGKTGRLYVDATTGKLFKQGDLKGGYVENLDYEITQVRTYKGLE